MRILVVTSEKNLAGLRATLAREGAGRDAVKAAEARLKAANPHVNFDRLARGDVIVVPDNPAFDAARATSLTGALIEGSIAQAKTGLVHLKGRVQAGEKEAGRLRDAVARGLKSRAVKVAADRDEGFRKDVERLREAVAQDEKDAAARQKALQDIFELVAADLADLQQRFP